MIDRRGLGLALLATAAATSAYAETPAATEEQPGEIVVTGQRRTTEGTAGTKTPSPIAETPQSISVIDAETIVDLGLQNLNQALRFVAGVTPEQRGAQAEVYDQFKLRGFDAPVYLDGLRQFDSATGYASQQVDVSRLDRIEIVKGPASALYGQSGPGGLVVQSSKLPLDRSLYGAIAGTYGTFDLYRVDADIGGAAGEHVLWRLNGSANGAGTQARFGKRERQTVSGAVTLRSGDTSLTLLGNYSHDPYNGTYGVFPAIGTLIPNPNGRITSRFDGGEDGNRFRREQMAGTYILRHDFGDGWAFRASGRLQRVTARLGLVYTSGAPDLRDPSLRTYNRASYATRERLNNWTYDNQLTGRFRTGPLQHDIIVGLDRQVAHSYQTVGFGTAPSINVYAPVYGTIAVPQTPETVPGGAAFSSDVNQRQTGIYAQDQISWGGLRVLLSGRQDWARNRLIGGTAEKSKKFTYRAGVLYKTEIGIAPYASYSTSFQPQTGQVLRPDNTVGQAQPSLGKQIEAGVKYGVPNTPILLTAAWFRIDQTNVLTANPLTFVNIQSGKVRSQGFEVEATAPLPGGFSTRIAYSRQRVKVREDADPVRVGKGLETAGRGGISANLEWTAPGGPLAGLTLGGAVRHVDKVYAGITAFSGIPALDGVARFSPDYTLFDALMRYDLGKMSPRLTGLSVAINATNLFNKDHLTSCYANYNWCFYGNRRTVQGTIGYRF